MNLVPKVRHYWRKTAWIACVLVLLSVFVSFWNLRWGEAGLAVAMFWMMTVPCGLNVINKNKLLWHLRQALFLSLGIGHALAALTKP